MRKIAPGSTDQSVIVRIVDYAAGKPATTVNVTDLPSFNYWQFGGSVTTVATTALASSTSAHSDGGMIHLFAGYFRLDIPDAAVSSGPAVVVGGGTTAFVIVGNEITVARMDSTDVVAGISTGVSLASDALTTDALTTGVLVDIGTQVRSAISTGVALGADAVTTDTMSTGVILDIATRVQSALSTGVQIADGHLTAAKFAADAITTDVVSTGVLASIVASVPSTGVNLAADSVTTDAMTTGLMLDIANLVRTQISTGVQIADGHLTAAKFGADAITTDVISTGVLASVVATVPSTGVNLAADSVTTDVVTTGVMLDIANLVRSQMSSGVQIADGHLTAAKFGADALTTDVISTGALGSVIATVADGSLTTAKFSTGFFDQVQASVFGRAGAASTGIPGSTGTFGLWVDWQYARSAFALHQTTANLYLRNEAGTTNIAAAPTSATTVYFNRGAFQSTSV